MISWLRNSPALRSHAVSVNSRSPAFFDTICSFALVVGELKKLLMSLTFGLLQVGVTPEIYFNGEVTEVFAEDVANDADDDEQAPKEGEEGEAAGDDEFGYEGEASCWQIPGLQMGVLSVLEKSRHIAMHAVKRFYLPDLPADDMYDAVVTRDHPVIVRPLQAPDQPRKPGDEEKLKEL